MHNMIKKRRLTGTLPVVNLIVRAVTIRPVCALGLMLIVVVGIYVNSPLYGYGRPVYQEGFSNYFTDSHTDNGDEIVLTGHVSAISYKESGGETVLTVTLSRVRTKTGLLLTGPFERVLAYFPKDSKIYIGQDISLCGNLGFFSHATNPGEFDYMDYERYRGGLFAVYDCEVISAGRKYSYLKMWLFNTRLRGENILEESLSIEDAAIMKAMLFGNKNEIPEETKKLFKQNGIAHILAISGLHISFLAMALYGLMRKAGIRQIVCMFLCSVIVLLYGIMVGFTISAFRAICMFMIFLLSKTMLRTYDLLSAMCLALALILAFKPGMINDAGFELSFAAVFGVGYLHNSFCKNIWKCPDYLNPVFVSLFIFLGTLPILLWSYYEVAFYSIMLNLVIIPLMSVLIVAALLLVIMGFAWVMPGISILTFLAAKTVTWILWLYKNTCALLTTLENGRVNLGKPMLWQVVLYCALIIVAVNIRGSHFKIVISTLIIIAAVTIISMRHDYGLHIYQMDIGQGDCQVIVNDNHHAYMVDGGSSSVKDVCGRRVIPLLKWAGVNEIDIFLSHPDEDHMNAIMELIDNQVKEHIKVKHLYIYEDFSLVVKQTISSDVEVVGLKAGNRLTDGRLSFDVLHPSEGYPVTDTNNASLVLKVSYGNFSMIDTGDVEKTGESMMIERFGHSDMETDILKVAHHGSSSSSSEEFLKMLSPDVALVSSGKKNERTTKMIQA